MEKRPFLRDRLVRLRAQRWGREILLAALLTIAAVVFIATATTGRDDASDQDKTPVEAAHQPPR